MTRRNHISRRLFAAGIVALVARPLHAEPMHDENFYELPPVYYEIRPEAIDLLRLAAGRPDVETRLETLAAITRHGIGELAPQVEMMAQDKRALVRAAVARAAAVVDRSGLAPTLIDWARQTPATSPEQRDMVEAADRALARWQTGGAVELWCERLNDTTVSPRLRASAATSLGAVCGGEAVDASKRSATAAALGRACQPDADARVLLAAARALGAVDQQVGSRAAARLIQGTTADRLAASYAAATGDTKALHKLAGDRNHAVAAAALRRLLDHPDESVRQWSLLGAASRRDDPTVRRLSYEAMATHRNEASVTALFDALADRHPDNRAAARASLLSIETNDQLSSTLRNQAVRRMTSLNRLDKSGKAAQWRPAEQLALLVKDLTHDPAAPLLADWLAHPHPAVRLASMRSLTVLDCPAQHPQVVALNTRLIDEYRQRVMTSPPSVDRDDTDLLRAAIQALGFWRTPEADPALRRLVPKTGVFSNLHRPAAVWALGRIHEAKPNVDLIKVLGERLTDLNEKWPEDDRVRLQSAIALGRMRAGAGVGALEDRYTDDFESIEIRAACRWALMRITGKELPPLEARTEYFSPNFLRPVLY